MSNKLFANGRSEYLAMGRECGYCDARAVVYIRHKHHHLPNRGLCACEKHIPNAERATGWVVVDERLWPK